MSAGFDCLYFPNCKKSAKECAGRHMNFAESTPVCTEWQQRGRCSGAQRCMHQHPRRQRAQHSGAASRSTSWPVSRSVSEPSRTKVNSPTLKSKTRPEKHSPSGIRLARGTGPSGAVAHHPLDTVRSSVCYEGNSSQYSLKSPSACTLAALEAAILLTSGEVPSSGMVNRALQVASAYQSDLHLDLDDLLQEVERYAGFKLFRSEVVPVEHASRCVEMLRAEVECQQDPELAMILIKPPESVVLSFLPGEQFALFDSHPRPPFNPNASLFVFSHASMAKRELRGHELFQRVDVGQGTLQDEMYNSVGAYILKRPPGPVSALPPLRVRKLVSLRESENAKPTRAEEQLRRSLSEREAELRHLRSRLKDQEGDIHTLRASSTQRDQEFRQLQAKNVSLVGSLAEAMQRIRELEWSAAPARTGSSTVHAQAAAFAAPSAVLVQETFGECVVCSDDLDSSNLFIYSTNCAHRTCRECAAGYLEAQLDNTATFEIECFSVGCKEVITHDLLSTVLHSAQMQELVHRSLVHAMQVERELTPCLTPDCDGVGVLEGGARFVCQKCSKEYCKVCEVEWHDFQTCLEFQEWRQENEEADKRTEDLIQRHERLKRCPSCKIATEW
eukprot:CAMPEP_0174237130 /NCGR_PEP_ID=MMETSP0417-20130205/7096_1 /TAXON_ID=242541 /ORGANISM="Mayorella sp, Strain BSH-02190019" /LENGTH=614 /DNA_ID=CAMNT_0015315857 /DNA_START=108 /DNA_END=1949 /DNA_ORIENTATION=-